MNEVNLPKATMTIVAPSTSSTGAVEAQKQSSAVNEETPSGKSLPQTEKGQSVGQEHNVSNIAREVPEAKQDAEQELESRVAEVNQFVQTVQRNLEFSLDKESNKTVVKVVDSGSGELIRQIPEDVFLELARNLKSDGQLQLVSSFG